MAPGTLPSPCAKVCVYDAAIGWCRGCGRTLGEIGAWPDADDDRRGAILAAALARRTRAAAS